MRGPARSILIMSWVLGREPNDRVNGVMLFLVAREGHSHRGELLPARRGRNAAHGQGQPEQDED